MNKITGIAGALAALLAVVAGVVPLDGLNVALILIVLGIIAGIGAGDDSAIRYYLAVLVLPVVGAALGVIPMVGEYLGAIANNLAVGAAGIAATLIACRVYAMVMNGVTGLTAK